MLNYETKFWPAPTLWNVTRQEPDLEENFAFVCPTNNENGSNGVLFVGINLLDGLVHNNREWQARHEANLAWIDEQYRANEKVFDVMTVLAHGDPLLTSNDNFFQTFFERVKEDYSERQVVVVHCNSDVNSWSYWWCLLPTSAVQLCLGPKFSDFQARSLKSLCRLESA